MDILWAHVLPLDMAYPVAAMSQHVEYPVARCFVHTQLSDISFTLTTVDYCIHTWDGGTNWNLDCVAVHHGFYLICT